ncbi:MAG TPA: hypothetical protein VKR32_03945 [Puia sp.]|nr:hypothetical protein [Puia sp.]
MANTVHPFGFKFIGIQINSKSMEPLPPGRQVFNDFNFNVTAGTTVNAENKIVMAMVTVIISEHPGPGPTLATFLISCVFQLEKFDEIIKKDEKGIYTVPPEVDNLFRPVAISTCRGIIFSELRGTYLHNAIMPVVFMDQFQPVLPET